MLLNLTAPTGPEGPDLSASAVRLLAILAREMTERNWTLLEAHRAAAELGIKNSDLLRHLGELESARLIERWPLGSIVYLTDAGRALAATLGPT